MSILEDQSVGAILHTVAATENINDAECHIDDGGNKGDGYLSQMSLVQITSKRNPQHVINLVIKCAQREPHQRNTFPMHQLYLREVRFYEEVMPAFLAFQKQHDVPHPFTAVPKYYASSVDDNKEFLIMRNIKMDGFELWNRKLPLDGMHTKLVLKNYAKFHAVSFAMRQQNSTLYAKLSKGLDNLFVPRYVDRAFFKSFELAMDKAIGLFHNGEETDRKYYERLSAFRKQGKILEFFNMVGEEDEWENPVITHGDSWLNNFMFNYTQKDGRKELQDVKIFDFQIMRHVSVIMDVAYVIYMNTDASLYNNYEHYLEYYYDNLLEHGKLMDIDIKSIFFYATLKKEWAKYGIYGLLFGLIGVGILLQDKHTVVDLSDVASGKLSAAEVFFVDNNSKEAVRRMRNLVIHFVDNNFI